MGVILVVIWVLIGLMIPSRLLASDSPDLKEVSQAYVFLLVTTFVWPLILALKLWHDLVDN